jgi:hypothetical protein
MISLLSSPHSAEELLSWVPPSSPLTRAHHP